MAPYYPPRKAATLERQAACLAFAAHENGMAFWSYIARYNDITAYQMKGWPDAMKWFDLPEALNDAAETLQLLVDLSKLRDRPGLLDDMRREVARLKAAADQGSAS